MISWLPEVCSQLHGEMVSIYWMMILPLIVLLIVLELFKTQDKSPDGGKILVRAVISILLLFSFKETINLIAFMGDGIADRIDGLAKMPQILEIFSENLDRDAPALYKVREVLIFLLNFISYFLAYFGIFVTEALIHFSWSILYVCAPLMILCYIHEGTSGICKNLYKGLFTVISWKIMWSILGVMLLKLATERTSVQSDNLITTAIINLCIAVSILVVPFVTKSLLSDGLSSFASGIAAAPGLIALGAGKSLLSLPVSKGASWSGNKFKESFKSLKGGNKPNSSTQNLKSNFVNKSSDKKNEKFINNKKGN